MVWCAARSFHIPAVDMGALRTRAPLAAVAGFASVAGSTFWRSLASSKPSSRFACSAISTDARIKEAVHTDKAPAALGPYSQAIKVDNFVHVSGCLGLIPETGKFVSDNVVDQTEQDLKLSRILFRIFAKVMMTPIQVFKRLLNRGSEKYGGNTESKRGQLFLCG
ncbi:reactive Intermediate Deaminase A, chloroplastic-like isoform X4 [Malus sylvestris]|uniref:reactive Intermediate Deaminase A, chloroplastic-like isoform X4 n=1 Tax=Malus sylvestris TaxID=3752 RepID=UPI0021AC3808|nr:reactive Intermediate Deaminase A, chloroplastic-like isoform X4 [Malus sylvestris]